MATAIPEIANILKTLRRAQQWIAIGSEYNFGEAELDGSTEMVPWDVLDGEIDKAIAQAEDIQAFALLQKLKFDDCIETLRARAFPHLINEKSDSFYLTPFERKQLFTTLDLLKAALAPFSEIKTPRQYANDLTVDVTLIAPREVAEAWALEWDNLAAAGTPPAWKRPDITLGRDFPVELLSFDDITLGDIRVAQSVMLALTKQQSKEGSE